MPDVTPHLGLPLLAAGQAQKHVTHNEALTQLDALVQLACLDKDLTAPPANPAEGDRYLVAAASPTGAWTGLSGQIVRFSDGVWIGAVPASGWRAYLIDEKALYVFDGRGWASLSASSSGPTDRLGVNTQPDATNRLAVKSNAALFAWDDVTPGTGDMRITLNKKAAAQDAGFVFQTGYSSRALFGLLASDDFVLKTSPDGSAFTTALTAAAATGVVSFAASPTAPTPSAADNSTRLATTAYVDRAASSATGGNARTQVSDANYPIQAADRTVAIVALTAARTLTLPAASAFPPGATVTVVDESGACSATNTITVAPAGNDTISGLASAMLVTAYGYLALQSNGGTKWTVVNRTPLLNRRTFASMSVNSGSQRISGAFTRVTLPVVHSDTGGNWDATNNWYVCPRTGIYQIAAAMRVADSTSAGTQYGIGVHTAEEDGPFFLWNAVGGSPSLRSSISYSRLVALNGGDRVRMISYSDTNVTLTGAAMQICLVSEVA
jgi:uncharacterized protein YjdB